MSFVNLVSYQFCYDLFYGTLCVAMLFALMTVTPSYVRNKVIDMPHVNWLFVIVPIIIFCMAGQPINYTGWENDRGNYALSVISYATANHPNLNKGDWGFCYYQFFVAKMTNYVGWFYLTATIYVMNYYFCAKRLCKEYSFVLFLMMLCTFQFIGYGSNTIRAGFAASFVILGMSFFRKPLVMFGIMILAFQFHKSMLLPVFMLLLSYRFKYNKLFLFGWFLAFALSLTMGKYFELILQGFIDDSRAAYLNSAGSEGYKVGFRWDFLIYSMIPIALGYYYIYKLNFKSEFYQFLWRGYLGANALWILVIRANFTDRFAYLSWFMFPLLIFYPMLTQQLYRDVNEQHKKLTWLIVGQGIYTFGFYIWKGL